MDCFTAASSTELWTSASFSSLLLILAIYYPKGVIKKKKKKNKQQNQKSSCDIFLTLGSITWAFFLFSSMKKGLSWLFQSMEVLVILCRILHKILHLNQDDNFIYSDGSNSKGWVAPFLRGYQKG